MKFKILPKHKIFKKINLPWLVSLPEDWRLERGKKIFKKIDIRSETGKEELLSVSSEFGVIPRKDANVTMFKAESYVGYKLCWPNDLVINSLWAWARGLGFSIYHGIVSSAYGVYRLKENSDNNPRYFHYLVRSKPFHWELQVRSKGIWTSRLQLTDDSFFEIPFPVPPIEEQNAIVRYLDYVDRRIQRYIRSRKKLIKLLEEYRQATIHQAVTRGLDPEVPFKPSGVEWLGDIPAHWDIEPGRACFLEKKKLLNTGLIEDSVLSLSYGRIIIKPKEKLHGLVPESFETYQIIEKNDIIVRPTDLQNDKKSFRFGLSEHQGIITSAYMCLKTRDELTTGYGYYLLHTYDLIKIIYTQNRRICD